MANAFLAIATTPSVLAAQVANGSAGLYDKVGGHRPSDRFGPTEAEFIANRDSFYMASVSESCTSYGALAAASGLEWSKARHQMNGSNGHLDRLLDICHARSLPMLTAICVNQSKIADGELEPEALNGFVAAARRLGIVVDDPLEFHHRCRAACWTWGAAERPEVD